MEKKGLFRYALISILIAVSMILMPIGVFAYEHENAIKLGTARIEVTIDGELPSTDSLEVQILAASLFDQPYLPSVYTKKVSQNGTCAFDIPLDTEHALAFMTIVNRNPYIGYGAGILELTQGAVLDIKGVLSSPSAMEITLSDNGGMNKYGLLSGEKSAGAYMMILFFGLRDEDSQHTFNPLGTSNVISKQDEDTWKEIKSILGKSADALASNPGSMKYIEMTYGPQSSYGGNIPSLEKSDSTWLSDFLKRYVYSRYGLDYNSLREKYAPEGSPDMAPLEYYSFLNEIDFDGLTNFLPMYGPYELLRNMLTYLPVGIEPIGETPVDQWQSDTKSKLSEVIDNVTPLLLDLLSAASYNMQMEDKCQPLTEVQIANINAGYNNDLGKMLLKRNSNLEGRLNKQ